MTDYEYAIRIYCAAFHIKNIDGCNLYIPGLLECINQLSKRERIALEAFYKHGLTYSQVGKMIGNVSRQRARNIIAEALIKFRQETGVQMCYVSQIFENNIKLAALLQEKK